jgi:hypothetical protein
LGHERCFSIFHVYFWIFKSKNYWRMLITHQRGGGVHAIQATCVTPPDDQIWASVESLDAQSCSLLLKGAHVSVWWSHFHRQSFVFFLFFSLSWEIKYIFILFVFYFLILVPILLISYFVFILFIDVFLFCNSIIRLHFLICFILVPILLIFYFIFIPFKEALFFNLALQLQFIILFYF